MDVTRAKQLLSTLADGVDPFTGELLPPDHVCNQPDIIRALHQLLDLAQVEKRNNHVPNAGKPWSEEEDQKLVEAFHAGSKLSAIAGQHGRTRGAIKARLAHLGLLEDSYFNLK